MAKTVVFAFLESPKLTSRKISVIQKSWNFLTVLSQEHCNEFISKSLSYYTPPPSTLKTWLWGQTDKSKWGNVLCTRELKKTSWIKMKWMKSSKLISLMLYTTIDKCTLCHHTPPALLLLLLLGRWWVKIILNKRVQGFAFKASSVLQYYNRSKGFTKVLLRSTFS